jgi:hypothetical protein
MSQSLEQLDSGPELRTSVERRHFWLLACVVLAVYWPILGSDFKLLDDLFTIERNARLNPPTWQGLSWYWTHAEFGLWIPVTQTCWWLLVWVSAVIHPSAGPSAMVFHAASMVLHVAGAWGVYRLFQGISRQLGPSLETRDGHLPAASLLAASLFAVHPVQVESVAWASGMKDVLAGVLAIWALVLMPVRGSTPRRLAASLVLGWLAMLAKPSAAVLPILGMVLQGRRGNWTVPIAWAVVAIPVVLVARMVQQTDAIVPATPLWLRPFVAGDALAFYLYKLAFPAWLTIDYGRAPHLMRENGWFFVTFLLPLSVAGLVFLARRREPLVARGGLFFLVALLPVLGLTPFLFQLYSTTADHYLYLPIVGAAIVLGRVGLSGARRIRVRAWIIILALAVRAFLQTWHWHDDRTLFVHAVNVNPRSWMAWNNLGTALLAEGEAESAAACFEQAVALHPTLPALRENLEKARAALPSTSPVP